MLKVSDYTPPNLYADKEECPQPNIKPEIKKIIDRKGNLHLMQGVLRLISRQQKEALSTPSFINLKETVTSIMESGRPTNLMGEALCTFQKATFIKGPS